MDNIAKTTPTGTELLKKRGRPKLHKGNGQEVPSKMMEFEVNIPPTPPIENNITPNLGVPPLLPTKKPRRIALLGTAPSSKHLAPFHDPEWEIWSCSPGNMDIPRADRWFEVHANLLFPENAAYGPNYIEWLKKQTFPIYMQDNRVIPNATPLPIQRLVDEFGKYFFTSSFAYMIAMAILEGVTEIGLFGIDMASKDEYILQRPGGHYFMQEAAKRGIKVSIPYESDLAQNPELYGYADSTPFGRKIHVRKKELEGRISQMIGERDKLQHSITYLQGALEDLDYVKSIWGGIQT